MTRPRRIVLELVGPSIVGGTVFACWMAVTTRSLETLMLLPVVLLFAPILCGVQSVLFTLAAECAFACGLDPASRWTVVLATTLGALSGAAIELVRRGAFAMERDALAVLLATGALTGCVLGLVIRARARACARRAGAV